MLETQTLKIDKRIFSSNRNNTVDALQKQTNRDSAFEYIFFCSGNLLPLMRGTVINGYGGMEGWTDLARPEPFEIHVGILGC